MNVFGLHAKTSAASRLIFGTVSAESIDLDHEVIDIEASRALFTRWALTDGRIRVEHELDCVAGRLLYHAFHSYPRRFIYCVGEIEHDDVWQLILAGEISGLSLGGRGISLGRERMGGMEVRRVAFLVEELSVCCDPCNPHAKIDFCWQNGTWMVPGPQPRKVSHESSFRSYHEGR